VVGKRRQPRGDIKASGAGRPKRSESANTWLDAKGGQMESGARHLARGAGIFSTD